MCERAGGREGEGRGREGGINRLIYIAHGGARSVGRAVRAALVKGGKEAGGMRQGGWASWTETVWSLVICTARSSTGSRRSAATSATRLQLPARLSIPASR